MSNAKYHASPPTFEDGAMVDLQTDSQGRLLTTPAPLASSTDSVTAVGNVAAGATDSGNPVKVGGKYNLAAPTLTDGQRGDLQLDSSGRLKTSPAPLASSTDSVTAVGDVASAATDSGNPVKVGGKYNSTAPTFTDGQRGDFQLTSRGSLRVSPGADSTIGSTVPTVAYQVAGVDASGQLQNFRLVDTGDGVTTKLLAAGQYLYNGTNNDRERGNFDTAALITATGATTSQTGSDQTNHNGVRVKVVLDMTNAGTGSVTLTIQGKDAASGKYYTLLAGAAVTTNSTNVYEVGVGLPATANVSANTVLPRVWRVITTANNANATTYTVGASVTR